MQPELAASLHQPPRYGCYATLYQQRSEYWNRLWRNTFRGGEPQMQSTVSAYGDGSTATKPKPFIFLITDGMQNSQHFFAWTNKYTYPEIHRSFQAIMRRGGMARSHRRSTLTTAPRSRTREQRSRSCTSPIIRSLCQQQWRHRLENNRVNGFSPTLATPLKSCASPGFFQTANTPTDINNALSAMFDQHCGSRG